MAEKQTGSKKVAPKDLPPKVAAAAAKAVKGGMMRSNPLKKDP